MNSRFLKPLLAGLTAALALSAPAHAHRAWILPSATVLSGDSPYITVDAAISNTLFHPDHHALAVSGISVTAPDGTEVELLNAAQGRYRSTFDVQLAQEGTYRIARASEGLRAFWVDEEGNRKMWPGRGQQANEAEFASAVPKDAKNLTVMRSAFRVETFVTAGAPTSDNLKPTGKGMELVALTHPNDLFATEQANFQLLIAGEPAAGAEIEVVPGGMRYRNSQEAITVTADSEGKFSVTWPEAGMYFMEASYRDDKAAAPATERRGSYAATFEVLPF